ncbi:MAG: histidinol-phosphatase HisJ family protein [Verrucomicrobiaceae bacterium]|nr:histidinol-phosphatase HisJ family protein [Verrucomicrobiaceae bacterium]
MNLGKLADYHMHTPLCRHAAGEPVEYARKAAEIGLGEIGFSDHSPAEENEFDDWRMLLEEFPEYLEGVSAARKAVPELTVRLGLEVDYLEHGEPWIEKLSSMTDYDYLIGSVHYIAPGWDIDNPKWIGRWSGIAEIEEIWEAYWRLYTRCAGSGYFDFIAHPDLPKKFGHKPEGDLRRFYEPAIEAASSSGTAIEINTSGWHKDCAEQYPARQFLEIMNEAGVSLVISSDAHAPDDVGRDFERAVCLALDTGFTQSARFKQRKKTLVELPTVTSGS